MMKFYKLSCNKPRIMHWINLFFISLRLFSNSDNDGMIGRCYLFVHLNAIL